MVDIRFDLRQIRAGKVSKNNSTLQNCLFVYLISRLLARAYGVIKTFNTNYNFNCLILHNSDCFIFLMKRDTVERKKKVKQIFKRS